ncbi:hypothetical protein [Pseudomonas sp. CFBP 8772]|uniref:hypothetical protein n=1 Tax=Pseudomonas sp. CFBP 8772 TaxID=2775284 RepID=UPI001784855F|nr:hypothetical protein [Pseudomonas sp. CFBP 8772]MBD8598735.1 hypothetical protein [Pseudomonas sp. CFBP 8772]
MIEVLFMGGEEAGPSVPWALIAADSHLSVGATPAEVNFPAGTQPGDLVVALASPGSEAIKTRFMASGWQHFSEGDQDYLCAARYAPGLALPRWEKSASNTLGLAVMTFRAQGWSRLQLESHISPAQPVNVSTRAPNELLISIGITPRSTQAWIGHMTGAPQSSVVSVASEPALQVYWSNVTLPKTITDIYVDAPSGVERNLILSAY